MTESVKYTMITCEDGLKKYVDDLRKKNVKKIALDMEGDQGMFRYKPSVSILQCFDGDAAVVIDVLSIGACETLRDFLTAPDIIKVMFSCGNDVFMAQNVLGCTIAPINDIAIAQKILGMPINLVDYLNIDKAQKDSFQRANWLTRPIKPVYLEYAVGDVLQLLKIEEELTVKLKAVNRFNEYVHAAESVSNKNYIANRYELYKHKFPGYMRLPFEKKKAAAAVWIFREYLAEKFDCPVGYMLSRKSLTAIINGGELVNALERELNYGRKPQKKLSMELIRRFLGEAQKSPYIPKFDPARQNKRRRKRRSSK